MGSRVKLVGLVKYTKQELQSFLADPNAHVIMKQKVKYPISLLPFSLGDTTAAIIATLNSHLMTYIPQFQGILLSFKNIKQIGDGGKITNDDYHINITLQVDLYIFTPRENCILKGVVNKISEDNIGCLVHREFNVAVPRPNAEPCKDWLGHSVSLGQEVLFQVVELNMKAALPYIRAKFLSASEQPQESNGDNASGHPNVTKRKKKKKDKHEESEEEFPSNIIKDESFLEDTKVKIKSKKKKRAEATETTDDLEGNVEVFPTRSEIFENSGGEEADDIDAPSPSPPKRKKSKKHKELDESESPVADGRAYKLQRSLAKDIDDTSILEASNVDSSSSRKKKKKTKRTSVDETSDECLPPISIPEATTSKIAKKKKSTPSENELNAKQKKSSKEHANYDPITQALLYAAMSKLDIINKKSQKSSIQNTKQSSVKEKKKKSGHEHSTEESDDSSANSPKHSVLPSFTSPDSKHSSIASHLKLKKKKRAATYDTEEPDNILQEVLSSVKSKLYIKEKKGKKSESVPVNISTVLSHTSSEPKGKRSKTETTVSTTQAMLDAARLQLGIKAKKSHEPHEEDVLGSSVSPEMSVKKKKNIKRKVDDEDKTKSKTSSLSEINDKEGNISSDAEESNSLAQQILNSVKSKINIKSKKIPKSETSSITLPQGELNSMAVIPKAKKEKKVTKTDETLESKYCQTIDSVISRFLIDSPKNTLQLGHLPKEPTTKEIDSCLTKSKIKKSKNADQKANDAEIETDIAQTLLDSAISNLGIHKKKPSKSKKATTLPVIEDPKLEVKEKPSSSKSSLPDPKSWGSLRRENIAESDSSNSSSSDESVNVATSPLKVKSKVPSAPSTIKDKVKGKVISKVQETNDTKPKQQTISLPDPKSWLKLKAPLKSVSSSDASSSDESMDTHPSKKSKQVISVPASKSVSVEEQSESSDDDFVSVKKPPVKKAQKPIRPLITSSKSSVSSNIILPYPKPPGSESSEDECNTAGKSVSVEQLSESSDDDFVSNKKPPMKKAKLQKPTRPLASSSKSSVSSNIKLPNPEPSDSESSEDETAKERIQNLINTLISDSAKSTKKSKKEVDSVPIPNLAPKENRKKKSKKQKIEIKSGVGDEKCPDNNIALQLLENFIKSSKGKQ